MIAIVLLVPSVISAIVVLPSLSRPLAASGLVAIRDDRRCADAAGGEDAVDHVDVGVDRRGVVHVAVADAGGQLVGRGVRIARRRVAGAPSAGVDGQTKTLMAGEAPVKLPPLASLYS